jgi:hypothetical protein
VLQCVELGYSTVLRFRAAAAVSKCSISHDAFGFEQIDNTFAIRPLAAQRASKNITYIRKDKDLS